MRQFRHHRRNGVGVVLDFAKEANLATARASAMAIAIVALWTSSPT
jgi:hypothetical protein